MSIGSNATILPVTICDHVAIGAGSVVARDIVKPDIYLGSPGRWVQDFGELEFVADLAKSIAD